MTGPVARRVRRVWEPLRWRLHDLAVTCDPARPLALRQWARARSLADLGELTARWVEGDLAALPGYYGRVDVDDAPGLAAALARANRAGLVTTDSQAGRDHRGDDGRWWTQLAWVSGVADPRLVDYLTCAAQGRDDVQVVVLAGDRPGPWGPGSGGDPVTVRRQVPVTWVDDQPYTVASWAPRRVLREEFWPGIGDGARIEVEAALQVAIVDPAAGRNTLWEWLSQTLADVQVWPTPPTPRRRPRPRRTGRRPGPGEDAEKFLRAGVRIQRPDAPAHIANHNPARRAA